MQVFQSIITFITSLPSAGFVGILMGLLCLAFGGGWKAAIRACCAFCVGITGINLIVNNCVTTMQGVATGLSARFGISKPIIDGGYGALAGMNFFIQVQYLALFIILIIDIIFIGLGWTKVLWVDIHNSWHGAFGGILCYCLTGDYVYAIIVTVLSYIVLMFVAEFVGPTFSEFNKTPNITSIAGITSLAGVFAWLVMKVINLIPGLKDMSADSEAITDKLGIFGESMIIGMVVGLILGVAAGFNLADTINCGIVLASTMAIFPKMAAFVCEGIVPVTTTLMMFMKKRFPGRKDLYLCVDAACFLGDPSVMATYVLLVPIIIIICMFVPAIGFIPVASLAGMVYVVGGIAPYCKGNIVHMLIVSALYMTLTAFLATKLAPAITQINLSSGMYTETLSLENGVYMTCFDEGGGILPNLVVFITKLLGKTTLY